MFEEAKAQYTYYADTKRALVRRMKKLGKKYRNDHKDWEQLGTHWQEMSMDEARKLGLEVVCAVENGTIIYRCNKENIVEWETGAVRTSRKDRIRDVSKGFIICFAIGFTIGLVTGILGL